MAMTVKKKKKKKNGAVGGDRLSGAMVIWGHRLWRDFKKRTVLYFNFLRQIQMNLQKDKMQMWSW